MLPEKRKILIHQLIPWILLLIIVAVILLPQSAKPSQPRIEDMNVYTEAYGTAHTTVQAMVVISDPDVSEGTATLKLYGRGDYIIYDKTLRFTRGDTDGELYTGEIVVRSTDISSYEITDFHVTARDTGDATETSSSPYFSLTPLFLLFWLPWVISSFFLNCKVYQYGDNAIIVYAGRFHRYLSVNGEKMDEANSLIRFRTIMLSCTLEDGTTIKARCSGSNRIALKVNNRLLAPCRADKISHEEDEW